MHGARNTGLVASSQPAVLLFEPSPAGRSQSRARALLFSLKFIDVVTWFKINCPFYSSLSFEKNSAQQDPHDGAFTRFSSSYSVVHHLDPAPSLLF